METRKRGGRRALLVVLALLLLLPCAESQTEVVAGASTETPAWEGTCMANCSKPLFNELFSTHPQLPCILVLFCSKCCRAGCRV